MVYKWPKAKWQLYERARLALAKPGSLGSGTRIKESSSIPGTIPSFLLTFFAVTSFASTGLCDMHCSANETPLDKIWKPRTEATKPSQCRESSPAVSLPGAQLSKESLLLGLLSCLLRCQPLTPWESRKKKRIVENISFLNETEILDRAWPSSVEKFKRNAAVSLKNRHILYIWTGLSVLSFLQAHSISNPFIPCGSSSDSIITVSAHMKTTQSILCGPHFLPSVFSHQ